MRSLLFSHASIDKHATRKEEQQAYDGKLHNERLSLASRPASVDLPKHGPHLLPTGLRMSGVSEPIRETLAGLPRSR